MSTGPMPALPPIKGIHEILPKLDVGEATLARQDFQTREGGGILRHYVEDSKTFEAADGSDRLLKQKEGRGPKPNGGRCAASSVWPVAASRSRELSILEDRRTEVRA